MAEVRAKCHNTLWLCPCTVQAHTVVCSLEILKVGMEFGKKSRMLRVVLSTLRCSGIITLSSYSNCKSFNQSTT